MNLNYLLRKGFCNFIDNFFGTKHKVRLMGLYKDDKKDEVIATLRFTVTVADLEGFLMGKFKGKEMRKFIFKRMNLANEFLCNGSIHILFDTYEGSVCK